MLGKITHTNLVNLKEVKSISMDPITGICNAIVAGCEVVKEYIKFLQTPEGQKVAAQQLSDLQAFKDGLSKIGDLVGNAIETAKESIKK